MSQILVQFPDGTTKRIPIAEAPLRIGRSRESDVFLPDQALSRQHAEIRPGSGGHYLVDLGSKNGTLLNETRIAAETLLKDGDKIRLGDYVLTFSTTAAPEEDDAPLGTRVFSAKELS